MQAPCRKGIAEGPPDHDRDNGGRGKDHDGKRKIAGRFEGEKAHGERSADYGDRERSHPDDGKGRRVRCQNRGEQGEAAGKGLADCAAEEQRREKKAASKAKSDRNGRGDGLENNDNEEALQV